MGNAAAKITQVEHESAVIGQGDDALRLNETENAGNEEVNEYSLLLCENELSGGVTLKASYSAIDPSAEMCVNGERTSEKEKVLGEWETYKRKKGTGKKKNENRLQIPIVHPYATPENGQPIVEGTSTSSDDPAIPPGFESHNRFHGFEEKEEEKDEEEEGGDVATSQIVLEGSKVSIAKPPSSKVMTGIGMKLSMKCKGTGMFPNGTLSSLRKKKPPRSNVPNKVSADKLEDSGSSWGLEFPPQKTRRKEMLSDLAKNHDGLIIEDVDEYAN